MASKSRTEKLNKLVKRAGSIRKAVRIILDVKGVAPSRSAIDRSMKGSGTDYSVQCMINDLEKSGKC